MRFPQFPLQSLIFSRVPPEVYASQTTDFFILSISGNKRRFTFIEPPESIARNLGVDISTYFPYQATSDRQSDKGLLVMDIREKAPGSTFAHMDVRIILVLIDAT